MFFTVFLNKDDDDDDDDDDDNNTYRIIGRTVDNCLGNTFGQIEHFFVQCTATRLFQAFYTMPQTHPDIPLKFLLNSLM